MIMKFSRAEWDKHLEEATTSVNAWLKADPGGSAVRVGLGGLSLVQSCIENGIGDLEWWIETLRNGFVIPKRSIKELADS